MSEREVVEVALLRGGVSSRRVGALADAVLSALSDRSRSEVGGDVVEQVGKLLRKFHRNSCYPDALDAEVSLYTLPIIEAVAADAERRVRERLVVWLRAWAATRQLGLTAKAKDICAQAILACARRIEREDDRWPVDPRPAAQPEPVTPAREGE